MPKISLEDLPKVSKAETPFTEKQGSARFGET